METRPRTYDRLLLGGLGGTSRKQSLAGGYREIHLSNGPKEEGVDRRKRADTPPIHALCGQTFLRGHWEAKVEGPWPQVEVGGHQPPTKVPHPPPRGVPLIRPPVAREQAMATGPAGISWPCESLRAGSLSPRGLPSRSPRHR